MSSFKPIPKKVGEILNTPPGITIENVVHVGEKLFRLSIYAHKYGFSNKSKALQQKKLRELDARTKKESERQRNQTSTVTARTPQKDAIRIIDYDWQELSADKGDNDRPHWIELPFIPKELSVESDSNFYAITSMGRNTPHYQFTGSEDTIEFEIDWFSDELSRKDVIAKCDWIKSFTKADGYNHAPRRVILQWSAQPFMFGQEDLDLWIIVKAPYKLTQFNRGYYKDGEFTNTSLLAQQAYQTVTLKRVVSRNLTQKDILQTAMQYFKT